MKNIVVLGLVESGDYLVVCGVNRTSSLEVKEVSEADLFQHASEIILVYASNAKLFFGKRERGNGEYVTPEAIKIAILSIKEDMEVYLSYSYGDLNINPVTSMVTFTVAKHKETWRYFEEASKCGADISGYYIRPTIVELDYKEILQSDLLWSALVINNSVKLDFVATGLSASERKQCKENFEKLVTALNIQYYDRYSDAKIIMGVLSTGDLDENWVNPVKTTEYLISKYGTFSGDDKILSIPLIDHACFFKSGNGDVYLVSNPYLTEEEIDEKMKKLYEGDNGKFYENLGYKVLGKDKTYWNLNNTNLVVFYLKKDTEKNEEDSQSFDSILSGMFDE